MTDITVVISRTREVFIAGRTDAVFMVDCAVEVGGEPLFPQIYPVLDIEAVVAALPSVPAGNYVDFFLSLNISLVVEL